MLKRHRDSAKHKMNFAALEKVRITKALSAEEDFNLAATRSEAVGVNRLKQTCDSHLGLQKNKIKCTCDNDDYEIKDQKKKQRWTPFFQPSFAHKPGCLSLQQQQKDTPNTNDDKSLYIDRNKGIKGNRLHQLDETTPPGRIISHLPPVTATKSSCEPRISQSPVTQSREDLNKVMKYYTKMKQDGWVLSNEGKWVKDKDCEFDSDDEPPKFDEQKI